MLLFDFQLTVQPICINFGVILESKVGNFGVSLESNVGNFGVTLGKLKNIHSNISATHESYFINFDSILLKLDITFSILKHFEENSFPKLKCNSSTLPHKSNFSKVGRSCQQLIKLVSGS